LSKVGPPTQEGVVQPPNPRYAVVVADEQLVSHAGIGLLAELADRLGLTRALEQFAGPSGGRARRHQPAKVLRDLVVMLADGGDCLSDLRLLGGHQALLGPVASIPTAWRVVERLARAGEDGLAGLRAARAAAPGRGRGRPAPRRPAGWSWTLTPRWWTPTPTASKAPPAATSTPSGSTRCWSTWTAAMGAASRWPGSSGRATPPPTTPPTT
jgi:hypothetical protein